MSLNCMLELEYLISVRIAWTPDRAGTTAPTPSIRAPRPHRWPAVCWENKEFRTAETWFADQMIEPRAAMPPSTVMIVPVM